MLVNYSSCQAWHIVKIFIFYIITIKIFWTDFELQNVCTEFTGRSKVGASLSLCSVAGAGAGELRREACKLCNCWGSLPSLVVLDNICGVMQNCTTVILILYRPLNADYFLYNRFQSIFMNNVGNPQSIVETTEAFYGLLLLSKNAFVAYLIKV